eukprot:CAMPEP_0117470240 /NCGR_PEP_ID=MMETSP0784-20121206/7109_1 /TAXON_ID=39447 /ORGANISM="" /LENGTH=306 /DNA_ID=CAMNT_0005264313 /DNA_START=573 /DNA_END=1492 /DNA_ORIENTATION=-
MNVIDNGGTSTADAMLDKRHDEECQNEEAAYSNDVMDPLGGEELYEVQHALQHRGRAEENEEKHNADLRSRMKRSSGGPQAMTVDKNPMPTVFCTTTQIPAKPMEPLLPHIRTGSSNAMTIDPTKTRTNSTSAASIARRGRDKAVMTATARAYPMPTQKNMGMSMLSINALSSALLLAVSNADVPPPRCGDTGVAPGPGASSERDAGEDDDHQDGVQEQQAQRQEEPFIAERVAHRPPQLGFSFSECLQTLFWYEVARAANGAFPPCIVLAVEATQDVRAHGVAVVCHAANYRLTGKDRKLHRSWT